MDAETAFLRSGLVGGLEEPNLGTPTGLVFFPTFFLAGVCFMSAYTPPLTGGLAKKKSSARSWGGQKRRVSPEQSRTKVLSSH